ncbi:unnamed protein product [Durusdinium trenchii]|uniref:Cystathionine gamma-lyase n=1 Tax=Durusdinium trenchii TaxID=1381693 RepID=A0ABP0LSF8_9DINO
MAVESEALVFSERRGFPLYARTWSRAREALESSLLRLYQRNDQQHQALIFPSGMAAIGATVAAIAQNQQADAKKPWILVHGNELYCEVPRTLHYIADSSGRARCMAVDVTRHGELRELFAQMGASIKVFHFETATNPSGQFFDFRLIQELRKSAPECLFVCDNTWLSGALFNPLDHGADLVVESMTKYVSAGMCIGGAVLGPNGLMAPILSWIKAFGIFVGQDHCQLFAEGLQSLHARMEATSKSAVALAECLEAHPAVNRVMYPLLPSHPTFSIAKRYLTKGGPGCLWFHVSAKKQHVMKTITAWTSPECKTSFGSSTSRLDPWPHAAPAQLYDQTGEQTWTRTSSGTAKHGTWLRLAVGYQEEVAMLMKDLDRLLAQLGPYPEEKDVQKVVPKAAAGYADGVTVADAADAGKRSSATSEGRWRRKL